MKQRVCILPKLTGLGGPVSFQRRLISGLQERDVEVTYDASDPRVSSILVIGATQMPTLWRARQRGVRVIQRLNGMNWVHRKMRTGLIHYLKSERNNWMLSYTRKRLASFIVYQSDFARTWWQTVYGTGPQSRVIYNGVDLKRYTPDGPHERANDCCRVLLVEGHLGGGNQQGLANAVELVEQLNQSAPGSAELMVAGDVPAGLKASYEARAQGWIRWAGVLKPKDIPFTDRSAHVLFSADLNAACPNSVIEALACGLPVIAFSTGALPELITAGAGRVVPYGSNYWNLEQADITALADAAREVFSGQDLYRPAARQRAEAAFGVDSMVDAYTQVLLI